MHPYEEAMAQLGLRIGNVSADVAALEESQPEPMSAKEFAKSFADTMKVLIDKRIAKVEQPLLELIQSLEERVAALEAAFEALQQ